MARTIQSLVTAARDLLHDVEDVPYRHSNSQILEGFNQALALIRRNRPDAYVGLYGSESYEYASANLTEAFPLDAQFVPAVISYMVAWCELREDQYTNEGRAAALLQRFSAQLMQVGA